jgi:transcription elongation GreA/GreB family factor
MITKLGKEKLEKQIHDLEKELSQVMVKRGKAAEEGDLKENSAYIFLGERAQVLMSQIDQANKDFKEAVVQSAPTQNEKIAFGHQVTIRFEDDNREMIFTLVGKNDSQLKKEWISCESPMGIALLGKRKSDQIMVNDKKVIVLDISLGDI